MRGYTHLPKDVSAVSLSPLSHTHCGSLRSADAAGFVISNRPSCLLRSKESDPYPVGRNGQTGASRGLYLLVVFNNFPTAAATCLPPLVEHFFVGADFLSFSRGFLLAPFLAFVAKPPAGAHLLVRATNFITLTLSPLSRDRSLFACRFCSPHAHTHAHFFSTHTRSLSLTFYYFFLLLFSLTPTLVCTLSLLFASFAHSTRLFFVSSSLLGFICCN